MKLLMMNRDADADVDSNALIYPSSYAGCHSSHGGLALGIISRGCQRDSNSISLTNGCITGGVDVTIYAITDGLSNTMTIADKSLTARLRNQPEKVNYAWFIGTGTTNQFIATYGPNVSKYDRKHASWSESAMSQHPGGVNVLMGDGSVRFVKNSVDATNVAGKPFGVWQRLASRNDGTPIESGSY